MVMSIKKVIVWKAMEIGVIVRLRERVMMRK